jgi:ATP/maltotriose-dependent transcriptional regulator MalT
VSSGIVNTLLGMAQYRQALAEGVRALDVADRLNDAGLRSATLTRLGATSYALGDFGQARHSLRESVAVGDQPIQLLLGTIAMPSVIARLWLALTECESGRFPEAIHLAEEGVHIARSLDRPFLQFAALWGLGYVRLRRGELERAASALEEGLEVGRTWTIVNWYPLCAATLGHVRTLTGRHSEALALLEDAVRQGSARGPRFHHALRVAWLAEAHLHAGRGDEARSRAMEALDLAVAHEERGSQAWTLRLLGEIAVDAEAAERYYDDALGQAEALGMRPLAAHCHLGLGALFGRTGNGAKTRHHRAIAATMFREMSMGLWLETAGPPPEG